MRRSVGTSEEGCVGDGEDFKVGAVTVRKETGVMWERTRRLWMVNRRDSTVVVLTRSDECMSFCSREAEGRTEAGDG